MSDNAVTCCTPNNTDSAEAPIAAASVKSHVGVGVACAIDLIALNPADGVSRPASTSSSAHMADATRSISTPMGSAATTESILPTSLLDRSCSSPQRAMILPRRPSLLPSRSAAANVSCVDSPLTCNTRAKVRTRSACCSKLVAAGSCVVETNDDPRSSAGCDIRLHHLFGIDDAIKFGFCNKAQLQGCSLEREIVIGGVVRNLRCLVIADNRRKRGHQHE